MDRVTHGPPLPMTARADAEPRLNRKQVGLLLAILALALGLRLYDLTTCLWYDEAASVLLARHADRAEWREFGFLECPVLMAILYPIPQGSESEFLFRLVPTLCGAVLVLACFALGRGLFGTTTGMVAGFVAAVNPFSIFFSREARYYTIGTLATIVSICALRRVWTHGAWRDWALFLTAQLACVYVHAMMFSMLIFPNLLVLLVLFSRGRVGGVVVSRRQRVLWICGQVIVFVLSLPRLVGYGVLFTNAEELPAWVPDVTLRLLAKSWTALTMGYYSDQLAVNVPMLGSISSDTSIGVVLVVTLVLFAIPLWIHRRNAWVWYAAGVPVLAAGGLVGYSLIDRNVFLSRYTVFFFAPCLVLIAHGLVVLARRSKIACGVAAAVLLAYTLQANSFIYANQKITFTEAHRRFDYRTILRYIRKHNQTLEGATQDNTVVAHFGKCSLLPFLVYSESEPRVDNQGVIFEDVKECVVSSNLDNRYLKDYYLPLGWGSIPFKEAIQHKRYIWFLVAYWDKDEPPFDFKTYRENHPDWPLPSDAAVRWMSDRYHPPEDLPDALPGEPKRFFGFMRLYLFDLGPRAGNPRQAPAQRRPETAPAP